MTTTTVISAQSIGTSTNIGNSLFATKVTLGAATSAAIIASRVTNAATGGSLDSRATVDIYYAFSPISVDAADAVNLLKQDARYLRLLTEVAVSADRSRSSQVEVASGQYLYLWCDIPTFAAAATLNVYVTEI